MTNLKHTAGEEAILSTLENAGPQAVFALNAIKAAGLPTRRVEAWHYTDLRKLVSDYPQANQSNSAAVKATLDAIPSQFACVELPIIDGTFQADFASDAPKGMKIQNHLPLIEASKMRGDDTIGLLNSGLAQDGMSIEVEANATIKDMVSLMHIASGDGSNASRHSVKVASGATATFIERHLSANDKSATTNTLCNLEVGEDAVVTWVIDQQLSNTSTRFGQLNVTLGKNADLTILSLNSGGKLVRQEINVAVIGEGSDLKIRGVNLIGEGAHIDVTTKLDHLVPETVSNEIFRNVIVTDGCGVFQGQINVAQIAQRTDARMACNSLLLSDTSEFLAKPELEIFADDVQCAHGATVTDIDDEHLFYLMARGIPEKIGRDMLITAFVEEVFDGLENEQIAEGMNNRIEEWLQANG